MKVTIEFQTGNAAFEDDPYGAVALLLGKVHRIVTHALMRPDGDQRREIHDENGNGVGWVNITV